jgi:7,8-dihydropterin-6-yl-methyl-4-(beta-D-ribofuranosyl)aminobenzene 5'-phosphate synthase
MVMRATARILGFTALGLFIVTGAAATTFAIVSHKRGVAEADRLWRDYDPPNIPDFGATRSLAVLPLVTWHTASEELKGEAGIAYLVRTDSLTVLFDVGWNVEEEDPSPLLHNMRALGVSLDEIDAIVISHNHLDHVGGMKWQRAKTFSLGNEQIDLGGILAYTPVAMTYPGLEPVHTPDPTVLGPGIATTGTIRRRLFMGTVDEQALVINVEGKGLVVIVGCGHQTLPKILERTEAVFDEPVYGLLGGLHYTIPGGRARWLGIDVQRRFASGDGPWRPITEDDVRRELATLQARGPDLVGLDAHDSGDRAIEMFREAFGPAYRDMAVGSWIHLEGG